MSAKNRTRNHMPIEYEYEYRFGLSTSTKHKDFKALRPFQVVAFAEESRKIILFVVLAYF